MADLSETLEAALVHSFERGKLYLPRDALNNILTVPNVSKELSLATKILSPGLADRIVQHASKTFAILCLIDESRRIKDLLEEGFIDDDLPIERDNRVFISARGKGYLSFTSWRRSKVIKFLDTQWQMQAPTFDGTGGHVVLDRRCPLPIRDLKPGRSAYSGGVYHVSIDKAHFRTASRGGDSETEATMRGYLDDFSDTYPWMFDRIRALSHPHIIKLLFWVRREEKGSSLDTLYTFFPFADYGSLEELWELDDSKPRSPELLLWTLQQITGLADGLRVFHQANGTLDGICSTTILRFCEPGEVGGFGRLVIAGIAPGRRGVYMPTTWNRGSDRQAAERKYDVLRPDSEAERQYRMWDVWSMGLTFLEFMLWLLHGMDTVKRFRRFRKQLRSDSDGGTLGLPHTTGGGTLDIPHTMLGDIFDASEALSLVLLDVLKDSPQFSKSTAWRDILSFLIERVFVKKEDRCNAEELHSSLQKICVATEKDVSYFYIAAPEDHGGGQPLHSLRFGA